MQRERDVKRERERCKDRHAKRKMMKKEETMEAQKQVN